MSIFNIINIYSMLLQFFKYIEEMILTCTAIVISRPSRFLSYSAGQSIALRRQEV